LLFDTERLYWKMFQDMLDAQTSGAKSRCSRPATRTMATSVSLLSSLRIAARDARMGFVLVCHSVGKLDALRRPAALEKTYPAMRKYLDEWIPRWTDSAHARIFGHRFLLFDVGGVVALSSWVPCW